LSFEGRLVILVLAAVGLAASAVAIWLGYKAAFGWMTLHSVSNDAELAEWYAQRRGALASSPPLLARSVQSAIASLIALFLAVGVLWLWPAEAPSPFVEVGYDEGGDTSAPMAACGKLITSDDGTLTLSVVDDGLTRPERINAGDITSITVKDGCP
jgi:hypothetical protein